MFSAIIGMLMAAQADAQPPQAPSAAESPAMAAARANRPRVKTNPELKSGPEWTVPEAAQAAGEFGKVFLSGIIGADGRFTEVRIVESSRSSLLDSTALAIASASLFEPARDENGAPLAVPAQMPVEFSNAKTPGKGGGVLRYKCGQFARDYDWWARTWPADKHDDFYYLVLGFSSLAKSQGRNGIDINKFATVNRDFGQRWKAAVEACRAAPDKLFIDVFQPEGEMLRRLARTN